MFKTTMSLAMCMIVAQIANAQSTYTVNSEPGSVANYHNLQTAVDNVPAGSVLLVQGSSISYGVVAVRKLLAIYGPGYFLGENPLPNSQAKPAEAILANIGFFNGSQGSTLQGVSFMTSPSDPALRTRFNFDSTANINVSRCKIINTYCNCSGHDITMFFVRSSNINFKQCYIETLGSLLGLNETTAVTISNSIITGQLNPVEYFSEPFNYRLENNSISANMQSVTFTNGTYVNNIIIQNPITTLYPTGSMSFADHNVSNLNMFPAGSVNITNAAGSDVFYGFTNPGISSHDGIWQLKPGSPAIGYVNGADAGGYGGSNPYRLSGIPAIPNIYLAEVAPVGTSAGGLKVRLRIKANN